MKRFLTPMEVLRRDPLAGATTKAKRAAIIKRRIKRLTETQTALLYLLQSFNKAIHTEERRIVAGYIGPPCGEFYGSSAYGEDWQCALPMEHSGVCSSVASDAHSR